MWLQFLFYFSCLTAVNEIKRFKFLDAVESLCGCASLTLQGQQQSGGGHGGDKKDDKVCFHYFLKIFCGYVLNLLISRAFLLMEFSLLSFIIALFWFNSQMIF